MAFQRLLCFVATRIRFSPQLRRVFFHRVLLITSGLCLGPMLRAIAAPAPLPAVDEKWRHFTSPHFELYSHGAERPSREVLYNLEILRSVFLERMKLEERLHVPVTVYYFRSEREFQSYAPQLLGNQSNLAGFHLFQPDRAIISLAPGEDSDSAQQVVFHEFVHHLFRISERDPPLWYNEGTAEVLAAMQVDGKRVQIGTPLEGRIFCLRQEPLLPLDQLFAATQASGVYTKEEHTGVFYAESWALLHFWHFGDSGFSKEAVSRFLAVAADRETAAKTDLRALFQSCFNCDYPEMLRRLKDYIRTGTYRSGYHPLPKIDAPSTYAVRPVDLGEITVRLAELAVRVQHSPAGKLILLNAMTGRPGDPRSFEALGTEAFLEQDTRTASDRWEQALAAGSKNPAILRELALMEGRAWFGQFNESFRPPADLVARMRSRLLRSIEAEPAQDAAYGMLAWVEAFAEIPDAKNINLIITHLPAMHDKKRALIGLSWVMMRLDKPDDAVILLNYLDTLPLDIMETKASSALHARLKEDYPTVARASTKKPDQTTIQPPPDTPSLKRPSVTLPDDL